jgi:hypothetical protein
MRIDDTARERTFGPEKPLIFVHFPKAAGTSLLRQLEAALGPALMTDYGFPPLVAGATIAPPLPPHVAAVYGHFRPGRYEHVRHAVRCTFLRHPVDTLISLYFYWKGLPPHGNPVHDRFTSEAPSIESFATYAGIRRYMSDTYFGGYDLGRFDFVGFHEHRAEDIRAFGALLGLPLDPEVHLHKTESGGAERERLLANPERLRRIAALVAEDVAFYEAALRRRRPAG